MENKIVIAGGSGFLGNHLINFYKKTHQIIVLTRQKTKKRDNIIYQNWDGKNIGNWTESLNDAEALINLSGKSINCRFTEKNKKELLASRINTTDLLVKAVQQIKSPPKIFINASAGSMYQESNIPNVETDTIFKSNFLAQMALNWEAVFYQDQLPQTRQATLRISLILGKEDGVFPVLKKITQLGLGGTVGSGKQKVSWIHVDDAVNAIDFIINNPSIEGPINLSTKNVVNNKAFMTAFRKMLSISIGLPAPAFGVKIASYFIDTEPSLLLNSVNFIPKKLLDAGFQFQFDSIDDALNDLNS